MRYLIIAIFLAFQIINIDAYAEQKEQIYICPMHPHIQGGKDDPCPICGMDLVLYEGEEKSSDNSDHHQQHQSGPSVNLSQGMMQTMGVKTSEVKRVDLGGKIRAFANIVPNERAEAVVTSRTDGWIEDLSISAVGDKVRKGDEIYKIHSTDVVIAQADYLLDLRSSSIRSKTNYKLFDHFEIDEKVVEELKRTKEPILNVPYYAEENGVVSELNVRKGSYVTINSVIARLQDYSTLWINASIAEKDLHLINKNTSANVVIPTQGNRHIKASIDYIHPTINPDTRTGLVRLIVNNIDGSLKPGGYADVEFTTNSNTRLAVPSEAVLKASDSDRVILSLGGGKFAPVNIKTGITKNGMTEIIEGLSEGDVVVTSSQFMIDSESSLREALNKFSSGGSHAGH